MFGKLLFGNEPRLLPQRSLRLRRALFDFIETISLRLPPGTEQPSFRPDSLH